MIFNFEGTHSFGSLFIVGLNGTTIDKVERAALKKLKPIGFMPLAKNFKQDAPYKEWLAAFEKLTQEFRECTGREKIIVSIDHEGGRVIRPPAPITWFPYPKFWADKVEQVSKAMALELTSLGINLSFSPDADIHSNPQNPVIGPRSFGTTPESVIPAALQMMQALLSAGVIPCAKHFPGHGATEVDSHVGLPTLPFAVNALKARELKPFQALIDAAIPMVMTAHILFPAIDQKNPATLSKSILSNLLRQEMKFQGVIISDSLYMHAVRERFAKKRGVVDALNAGCDMFIASDFKEGDNVEFALNLAKDLETALKGKEISANVFEAPFKRISKLLDRLTQHKVFELSEDRLSAHLNLSRSLVADANEVKKTYGVELYPPHRKQPAS